MALDFLSLKNREELANFLGVEWKDGLAVMLYGGPVSRLYKRFDVPKQSGGVREIAAPTRLLYEIQQKLHKALREIYRPPFAANGFIVKRGIVRNALPHVGAECLLAFDLQDFFPSINFGRVRGLFMAKPFRFPADVASVLAHICCLDASLPQGAPTSPIISNMICRKLDKQLSAIARRYGCTYTRYADDVTFSGKKTAVARLIRTTDSRIDISAHVLSEVSSSGFSINPDKTRLLDRSRSMLVTGLVTNERLNVRRRRIRRLRSFFYWVERYGEVEANSRYLELRKHGRISGARAQTLERYLRGSLRHLMDVRGKYDPLVQEYQRRYNALGMGSYRFDLSPDPAAISQNCYVLESSIRRNVVGTTRAAVDEVQGTAFLISKRILVTCSHCVGSNTYIFFPQNPASKVRAWLVGRDDAADVAILRTTEDQAGAGLSLARRSGANIGEEVTMYGFPRFAPGAGMAVNSARVVQIYRHFGRDRIRVSSPIVSGNSGGPVLNANSQVIGVAATGKPSFHSDADENDYGVVMLRAVEHLLHEHRMTIQKSDPSFTWG